MALVLVSLTACGAESTNGGSAQQADAAAPAQGQQRAEGNSADESNTSAESQTADRMLIRTATVELRADDVGKAVAQVKGKAQNAGGFAGQENATQTFANVTVRVPGKDLDRILDELGQVGEVTRREVRSEDVTEQVVDVEARIASQRASVDRVRALFERASSTSEITQIESELNKRVMELESLQRRYDSLKGKVSMATLTVSVSRRDAPPPEEEATGFLAALSGGWTALTTALRWVLIVVGAVLPFAVVLGVPAAAVIILARRRRRVTRSSEAG